MEQIKRIEEIANSVLEAQNLILYETCWRKEGSMKILQIAIMRHDGTMDIDTCSQISEAISVLMNTFWKYVLRERKENCGHGRKS